MHRPRASAAPIIAGRQSPRANRPAASRIFPCDGRRGIVPRERPTTCRMTRMAPSAQPRQRCVAKDHAEDHAEDHAPGRRARAGSSPPACNSPVSNCDSAPWPAASAARPASLQRAHRAESWQPRSARAAAHSRRRARAAARWSVDWYRRQSSLASGVRTGCGSSAQKEIRRKLRGKLRAPTAPRGRPARSNSRQTTSPREHTPRKGNTELAALLIPACAHALILGQMPPEALLFQRTHRYLIATAQWFR